MSLVYKQEYLPVDAPIRKECFNKYERSKKIGSGSYGNVFSACLSDKDCNYVMKIQLDGLISRNEIKWLKRVKNLNIGPEYVESWICDGKIFIITKAWSNLVEFKDLREDEKDICIIQILKLLKKLTDENINHSDLRIENVIISKERVFKRTDKAKRKQIEQIKVGLIDFGLTKKVNPKTNKETFLRLSVQSFHFLTQDLNNYDRTLEMYKNVFNKPFEEVSVIIMNSEKDLISPLTSLRKIDSFLSGEMSFSKREVSSLKEETKKSLVALNNL